MYQDAYASVTLKFDLRVSCHLVPQEMFIRRRADFLQASLDLGHEYARLGKSERAAQIYASVRHCISNSIVPDELKALYFLRYAELLGAIGNILKG